MGHPPFEPAKTAWRKKTWIVPRRVLRYTLPRMSITEIRQLPLNEKLQIMEAIWEDLRSRAEDVPVPQWHQDLLDSRDEAVRSGREEVLDWDEVKHSLGARRT